MTSKERIDIMRKRLQEKFKPEKLEISDDSHLHVGHAGSRDGAGHYTVEIATLAFKNKSRVDAHREIYQVFADLIPQEVHALRIKIV